MLDTVLPKLTKATTINVLSPTLPPHVIRVIKQKVFRGREAVHIQPPLNRQNIVCTTRVIADLSDYKNLTFLVPRQNPNSRPSGVIIFFESVERADSAATFLNSTFHSRYPSHKSSWFASSYHSGLSRTRLTRVFQQFCGAHESGDRIDILCATSCGATVCHPHWNYYIVVASFNTLLRKTCIDTVY